MICTGDCNGNPEQCAICNHEWTEEDTKALEEALTKVFGFKQKKEDRKMSIDPDDYSFAMLESHRQAFRELRTELEAVKKQLPVGMQDCTIVFNECALGHGWLSAANWTKHPCPTCQLEAAHEKTELVNLIADNWARKFTEAENQLIAARSAKR